MKYRNGFVSNSSSSSFTIPLSALTNDQVSMICGHPTCHPWNVWKDEHTISGESSSMIFDMKSYLCKIGVPSDVVTWEYR